MVLRRITMLQRLKGPRVRALLPFSAPWAGQTEDDHEAMLEHALIQSRRRYRA
jgi:hypothetical protein